MPSIVKPLTNTEVAHAKPKEKVCSGSRIMVLALLKMALVMLEPLEPRWMSSFLYSSNLSAELNAFKSS